MIASGILLVIVSFIFFKYAQYLWKLRTIPTVPDGFHPLFGHFLWILRYQKDHETSVTESVYALAKVGFANDDLRKKGIFKFFLGPLPFVIVFSPEIQKVLLRQHNLPKSFIYKTLNVANDGLLSMDTSSFRWKFHRKLLTPAFHFDILDGLAPIVSSQCQRMLSDLNDHMARTRTNVIDDIEPFIARNTFRILCESSMGSKLEHLKDDYFQETVHRYNDMERFLVDRMFKPWLMIDSLLPYYEEGRKCQKLIKHVLGFAMDIFNSAKKTYDLHKANNNATFLAGSTKKPSFVEILFREMEDNPKDFTLKDAHDEFGIFLGAGFDTTTMSLTWCLLQLGHLPEIQEKCYDEIMEVVGDGEVTMMEVKRLTYVEAVIKESMRLIPSVPAFSRQTDKDIPITMDDGSPGILPKWTIVNILMWFTHRLEDHWSNPDEFDPERFMSLDKRRHPFAYLPFSAGPRNCIGMKYAMAEMKMVLAIILRRYRITSLQPVSSIRTDIQITIKPRDPISVVLHDRKSVESVGDHFENIYDNQFNNQFKTTHISTTKSI